MERVMRDVDLSGKWEFRQAARTGPRIKNWLPATVPGTVHTDLLAAGKIEDPFYRANESNDRWIDQADWIYRRSFHLEPEFLREARAVWLDFEGLDTIATVRLNGRDAGRADNMFHSWRFDARPFIKSGANQLEVEFSSAPRIAAELAARSRVQYRATFHAPRVWLRKAQYSGGWDWAPRFLTCGIWRPVRLRAVKRAEIRNVHAHVTELNEHRAVLAVQIEIESHVSARAAVRASLQPRERVSRPPGGTSQRGPGCPPAPRRAAAGRRAGRSRDGGQNARLAETVLQESFSFYDQADLAHGIQIVSGKIIVENPALWWPNGMGPQALYDLNASLEIGGETVHTCTEAIGLRSVELVRERDGQGESFRFRVNGRDVFCKGANWVPGDSFLPRFTPDCYRPALRRARDAHMNMLRVWGGGVYEDPAFYRACDELGLMVWQDFMFSGGEYPEDTPLLENVRREAQYVVRRLRNHPCVVLWCGNNEVQWFFDELGAQAQKRHGEAYYNDILPAVCREHDPHRPYWPGSPSGGPRANDSNFGDQHVWSVWGLWQEPRKYRECPARFASEFGFQAMPAAATVREFTAPEDRRLFSPVIDHHDKAEDGHARIMKFLANSLGPPADLDDYVYLSQVQQADAMKIAVEHWRQRWPASAGALYSQFNDCWPAASWSAMDFAGRAKALLYASRRFFSPAMVSFSPAFDESYGLTDLDLWVTWEGQDSPPVRLEVTACTLDGKVLKKRIIQTRLPPNSSKRVVTIEPGMLGLSHPEREFAHVRMSQGGRMLSSNCHYFAPAKYIHWPDPGLRVKAVPIEGGFNIEVAAKRVARAVCLSADDWPGQFSDNFFDLFPGEPVAIVWTTSGRPPSTKSFTAGLAFRCMKPAGMQILSGRERPL